MADDIPSFKMPTDDQLARLKADFGDIDLVDQPEEKPQTESTVESPPPKKRGRGRPRKYARDEFGRVLKDKPLDSSSSESFEEKTEPLGTLPNPPLTTRDQKEIAKRFQNLLIGASSIGAVFNPHIQMTNDEAENIAAPLTTYLARTEATSQIARRVLNDYDLAAFAIAFAAYGIRVMKDMQRDRATRADEAIKRGRTPKRAETSGRAVPESVEPTNGSIPSEYEEGQVGFLNPERASTVAEYRRITEV